MYGNFTDLEASPTCMYVGGCDKPFIDLVGGLGPIPSTGPIDCPPRVEVGHAASTLDLEQTHIYSVTWTT